MIKIRMEAYRATSAEDNENGFYCSSNTEKIKPFFLSKDELFIKENIPILLNKLNKICSNDSWVLFQLENKKTKNFFPLKKLYLMSSYEEMIHCSIDAITKQHKQSTNKTFSKKEICDCISHLYNCDNLQSRSPLHSFIDEIIENNRYNNRND